MCTFWTMIDYWQWTKTKKTKGSRTSIPANTDSSRTNSIKIVPYSRLKSKFITAPSKSSLRATWSCVAFPVSWTTLRWWEGAIWDHKRMFQASSPCFPKSYFRKRTLPMTQLGSSRISKWITSWVSRHGERISNRGTKRGQLNSKRRSKWLLSKPRMTTWGFLVPAAKCQKLEVKRVITPLTKP